MNILIENSTWNNIGDGFYQFPIFYLLNSIGGDRVNVAMIDGPIKRAFRLTGKLKKKFKDNAFDISKLYDGDLYVFSGPILGHNFLDHYSNFIRRIKECGANYIILSAHSSLRKRSDNLRAVTEFLQQYEPLGLSTRDRYTFEIFNSSIDNCYDGICCAFYSYLLVPMPKLKERRKYITVSFYKNFEPYIDLSIDDGRISSVNIRPFQLARYSSLWRFLRHVEFLREFPSSHHGYEVIRPNHGIGTSFINVDFSKCNSYLSFNPLSYLSLYQGSSLTISDRVHSCVVTLASGKPALFYSNYINKNDYRPKIFDRAPVFLDQENGFYYPDIQGIRAELHLFKQWLQKTLEISRNSLVAKPESCNPENSAKLDVDS